MHTPSVLDLDQAIQSLNSRLTQALSSRDTSTASDCRAVAGFLAHELGTVRLEALAARARAVARYLEINRHV